MSIQQSGADAIKAILAGEHASRVPSHDSPWPDTMRKWAGQGMPVNPDGTDVDPVEHFGFDMAGCGGWFDWLPEIGFEKVLEENADWRVIRNGAGAVFKQWKNKSGTPEHIDFHMSTREIWDKEYRQKVVSTDPALRLRGVEDTRKSLARRRASGVWTFYGSQFVWENLRASLGDYNMFMALAEDPGWIHDFNRVYTDLLKTCYTLLFEKAGLPDGVWVYEDLGYKDKLFCNPSILEELIFPYYKEMVDFFHSHRLPVIFHSCGYQKPLLPLVVDAGFDALNPMEVKAGNDILAYAREYGGRLAFVGGLDARILESGDRKAIKKGVSDLMAGMRAAGARHIYGSDHSLSTLIDYGDFRYSLEVYRSLA